MNALMKTVKTQTAEWIKTSQDMKTNRKYFTKENPNWNEKFRMWNKNHIDTPSKVKNKLLLSPWNGTHTWHC